jgi:hypothetical protein
MFAVIVMALMLGSCAYGFGQHIANLTAPNKLMTLKVRFGIALDVALQFYVVATDR